MLSFTIDKTLYDVRFELAQKVRVLLKQKKYSQEEMAQRSNVSLGSYKRFERTGQISIESFLRSAFVLERLNEFDSLFVPNNQKELEKLFRD